MAAKSGRARHPGRASAKRPDAKHAVGRPSAFSPKYSDQARKLCLLGFTDRELANFFGVSEQTLNTWKHAHPEFLESLKAGKSCADAEVSAKLYERALGYSHKAVKIFNTEEGTIEHEYVEHYPPDSTAAIFWLKNRNPDHWRDKQHIETRAAGAAQPVEEMSVVDIEKELARRRERQAA